MERVDAGARVPGQALEAAAMAREIICGVRGIYLYGSAALGGLRPDSDLDILVIIDGRLRTDARAELTRRLLRASGRVGCAAKRPLELTVMSMDEINPLRCPPACEYMYGEWLRAEIEAGALPAPHSDPDLVLLIWQARAHGVALFGPDARALMPEVAQRDVFRAIAGALPGLMANLAGDERNVLLTLARMWYTLSTGELASKDGAADWAMARLPAEPAGCLSLARDGYLGRARDAWQGREEQARALAERMARRIEELAGARAAQGGEAHD